MSGISPQDMRKARITPYLLDGDTERPAVLVFPGGGYGWLAPHEGEPMAKWLNSLGLHAFVVHYRIKVRLSSTGDSAHSPSLDSNIHGDEPLFPAPLLDGIHAIRYVRHHAKELHVDANRIGIMGSSAGGHLCGMLAAGIDPRGWQTKRSDVVDSDDISPEQVDDFGPVNSLPDFTILCYPLISLANNTDGGSVLNLFGLEPTTEMRVALSIERQVTPDFAPTFIWHTADDAVVSVSHSLGLCDALGKHGVPFELHVYPEGVHGLGLAENDAHVSQWTEACATWLQNQGFRQTMNL